jgi:hypothetical protein
MAPRRGNTLLTLISLCQCYAYDHSCLVQSGIRCLMRRLIALAALMGHLGRGGMWRAHRDVSV